MRNNVLFCFFYDQSSWVTLKHFLHESSECLLERMFLEVDNAFSWRENIPVALTGNPTPLSRDLLGARACARYMIHRFKNLLFLVKKNVHLQTWEREAGTPAVGVIDIQKQTKNRNETGSNLSLGTRMTALSKRLGRKRPLTQRRTVAWSGVVSLSLLRIVKKCLVFFQNRGFWWDPRARRVPCKKLYAQRRRLHRKFTSKNESFPTWAPLPNPKN